MSDTVDGMTEDVFQLLDDLENAPHVRRQSDEARARLAWLDRAQPAEIAAFFERLPEVAAHWSVEADGLLADCLTRLARRPDIALLEPQDGWIAYWNTLAQLPIGSGSAPRGKFLYLLARGGTSSALKTLTGLLVGDEKIPADDAIVALATVVQADRPDHTKIFPELLAGLANADLAPAILDLANYWTRRGDLQPHPAAHLVRNLATLLSNVVNALERIQENPFAQQSNTKELADTIGRGVSLGVSLCDSLGLIGDVEAAGGPLQRALDLPHRRLKTEAAGALARLGVQAGQDELVRLAAEPVARLRVLAYADELGLSDKIPPEFASDEARAEAQLATWLSEPLQFGLPPNRCELLDQREQYWPGFEAPVRCYLFRFEYEFQTEQGTANYANVGIAGPFTHAVTAEVLDLSPDDIYALYAGWNVEHVEIFEIDFALLNEQQRVEVARYERRLKDDQYDEIRPKLLCSFFGERSLAAIAQRGSTEGAVVVDSESILWLPATQGKRSLGVNEAIWINRGRKMLREFNP